MPVSIYLGPEVATFPTFDNPDEVGAMLYAIDKLREQHKQPPYNWSPAELVELGVPQDVAEKIAARQLPDLYAGNGGISTWDDIRQLMI